MTRSTATIARSPFAALTFAAGMMVGMMDGTARAAPDASGTGLDDGTLEALAHLGANWPPLTADRTVDGGLIDIARREAALADRRIARALDAAEACDLAALRRHVAGALHAINPASVGVDTALPTPGTGVGLVRAARDGTSVAYRIGLTVPAGGALEDRSAAIATAFTNLSTWGRDAGILLRQAARAETAAMARPALDRAKTLTAAMVDGRDADGDGERGDGFGEAGLQQAETAYATMLRAANTDEARLRAMIQDQQRQAKEEERG